MVGRAAITALLLLLVSVLVSPMAVAATTTQPQATASIPVPGDDCQIGFRDVLTVIDAYNSNEEIGGVEVGFDDLLRVIELYNSEETIPDCTPGGGRTATTVNPTPQTQLTTIVDSVDVIIIMLLLTAAIVLRRRSQ